MKKKSLGELCDIVSGGTPSRSHIEYWDKGSIPWIKIGNIKGKYVSTSDEYITQAGLDGSSAKMLPKGTLLYTIFATLGEVGILTIEACTNQAIAGISIKHNDEISTDFLYYYLKSKKSYVNKIGRGVAQNNINMSMLRALEVPVPNIAEQSRIVSVLDSVASVVTIRQQQLEKLDELVKARFVEMFGELHYNRHGFKIVSVEEVCTMVKDGTHQTPQYTTDDIHGFKFLSSKDVMSQKVDWKNIKYIPSELHEKLYSTLKPQRDDILMSKNGVNYGVAAVNDSDEVFDIYVSLALLRPKPIINPIYFRCVINNPDTKEQFDSSIKGIGVPNLHLGEIKKTKILLPPIKLQNQFASFVEQTDKSKAAVQESLDEAQLLFDSLMQRYFE